ncbi:hypothetical protein Gohar_015845 [Gossypium harknessii]|uniref:Glycosyltransferase n=1 Tax=Gossypium harknessii TaxID=34285 RepID=A0A7J9G167_9ROSI|nr:hypothetical protein [Gossypium harknessii]
MKMQNKAKKPHVLIFPFPGQGHINPMLQFAKRLHSKGVKATMVPTVFLSKSSFFDSSASIDLCTISDGFDEGGFEQADTPDAYLSTLWNVGPKSLAALIKKLGHTAHPVDALVYDTMLPWALDVAKQFGISSAAFFTQSCAVNSVYYHVYKGHLQLPLRGSHVSLPAMPPLHVSELPSFVAIYGVYRAWLDVLVDQFSNINEADWVFFNHFYELEPEVVDWMSKFWNVMTVGPTIPSMYLDKTLENDKDYGMNMFKPNAPACMSWLSGKPKDSVVLSHESVGCFLTHCGFNSTVEALSLGVPMLALPQWTDQCTNAKYIEAVWRIGIRARPDEKGIVRKETIIRCIMELLMEVGKKGEEIKKNSIKWKYLAKKAVDEGGKSDKNVDEFIAKLI